ncbi:MAG: 50S ribosomal protein L29 [Candidatus Hydrogenedentes bacterium]|nr:50S ribosomal protein L29 [Candidatus Hydrogenedentota bacterium]
MKAKDIRELTSDELQQQLKERNEALWAFRMQMSSGVVDNVRGARNARRDVARIRTILRQREIGDAKGKK